MRKIRWLNAILAAFAMFFVLGLCSCSQLFEDLGGGLGGLGGSKGGEAPAKVAWLDYDFDRDNLEWERSEAPRARYRIEIDGVEIQDPDTHYGTEKISFDYAATGDFTATVWVENEYGVSEKLTQSFRCLKPIEPMLDKATERTKRKRPISVTCRRWIAITFWIGIRKKNGCKRSAVSTSLIWEIIRA